MTCPTCGSPYSTEIRFCPNDGSVLRPLGGDVDELVGRIIDERYCLERKVGQGGMGEVYLGEHVRTRRKCAVKIINRSLARDVEALNRFIREATNAGRINHPHVAGVYDFGETDDGLLYLAMEYVDGEPLSKLIEREGALSPARAVEIARQVADAVGAAHELGIIHRDLKPSNIMIARDRRGGDLVKVVDFGIARTVGDEQQRLTRTGLVIGTPEYMSPEQLIGDPVEARSDIYSLGCILYQMLTGEHAFGGTAAHVITRRLTEPPPRPRTKNPAIPKPLDDVIVTALGRTPAERFPSMDAMREALLAAPTQPVTTGPRRVAAWLGLDGITGERAAETPVAHADEPAAEDAPDEQASLAGTSGATPPAEFPVEPSGIDDAAVYPEPGGAIQPDGADGWDESDEAGDFPAYAADADGPGEDYYDFAPPAESSDPYLEGVPPNLLEEVESRLGASSEELAPDYRPRRRLPMAVLGVAVLAALLISAFIVFAPGPVEPELAEGADWQAPVDPAPEPEPLPLPPQPDTVHLALANLRAQLALADREDSDRNFAAAIGLLRTVGSSLTALSAENADVQELRSLADSARTHLESVERRCRSLAQVERQRGGVPPNCEPGG
jgi:hypothetical protein